MEQKELNLLVGTEEKSSGTRTKSKLEEKLSQIVKLLEICSELITDVAEIKNEQDEDFSAAKLYTYADYIDLTKRNIEDFWGVFLDKQ